MESMEGMIGLGVLNGNFASHREVDNRWERAEAKGPVRGWLELCERDADA